MWSDGPKPFESAQKAVVLHAFGVQLVLAAAVLGLCGGFRARFRTLCAVRGCGNRKLLPRQRQFGP